MTKIHRTLESSFSSKQWFFRVGWFFCLIGVGSLIYFHALRQKKLSYEETAFKLYQLEKEKAQALATRDELLLQIQSQTDPAWVEMVLKKNLGMVSDGQVKVYFHSHDDE